MKRQIAVVGGGPAGWNVALSLARGGFDTVLLAGSVPADRRTTALLGDTVDHLVALGVFARLENAEPLRVMRIVDDTGRLLRAPTVEFRAAEVDRSEFGFNVQNTDLASAFRLAAENEPRLTVLDASLAAVSVVGDKAMLLLEDGVSVAADLVVGADGRRSIVRESAGIRFDAWSYPQTAIVLNFSHRVPHRGTSTEFHTATGPFTQVPLKGSRSSLVWVETPAAAGALAALPAAELSRVVEERMHSILGAVEVEESIQSFPIAGGRARQLVGSRTALVGESAHVFPPIGAQGLNLGIRDGKRLADALAAHRDDPGLAAALSRYAASARGDVLIRTLGTDLLNRSLLADFLPVQLARALTLQTMAASAPMRRFAMREGLTPTLGLRQLAARLAGRRGTR